MTSGFGEHLPKYTTTVITQPAFAALAIEMAEQYCVTGSAKDKKRFKQAVALMKKTGWDAGKKRTYVQVKGEKAYDVDFVESIKQITGPEG